MVEAGTQTNISIKGINEHYREYTSSDLFSYTNEYFSTLESHLIESIKYLPRHRTRKLSMLNKLIELTLRKCWKGLGQIQETHRKMRNIVCKMMDKPVKKLVSMERFIKVGSKNHRNKNSKDYNSPKFLKRFLISSNLMEEKNKQLICLKYLEEKSPKILRLHLLCPESIIKVNEWLIDRPVFYNGEMFLVTVSKTGGLIVDKSIKIYCANWRLRAIHLIAEFCVHSGYVEGEKWNIPSLLHLACDEERGQLLIYQNKQCFQIELKGIREEGGIRYIKYIKSPQKEKGSKVNQLFSIKGELFVHCTSRTQENYIQKYVPPGGRSRGGWYTCLQLFKSRNDISIIEVAGEVLILNRKGAASQDEGLSPAHRGEQIMILTWNLLTNELSHLYTSPVFHSYLFSTYSHDGVLYVIYRGGIHTDTYNLLVCPIATPHHAYIKHFQILNPHTFATL